MPRFPSPKKDVTRGRVPTVVKGMLRKRFLIVPGLDGRFTHLISRLFPSLVEYMMEREINKVAQELS